MSLEKGSTFTTQGKLVNNPNFADVIINVEKQMIYCHSQILNARCPLLLKRKPKKKEEHDHFRSGEYSP